MNNEDMTVEQAAQQPPKHKRQRFLPEQARDTKCDDDLLTTEEVVLWTGFTRQAFEGWRSRRNGGPLFIKFPQKVMYRRGDVKAWIEQHRVTPTTTA